MRFLATRGLATLAAFTFLAPAAVVQGRPCWHPPVAASIADPFREPACAWCPGNRGLEYRTAVGDRVFAVSTGTVSYAGTIAGTRYLVVRHADGLRATYANLRSTSHRRGDLVIRGTGVGEAAGRFHFGLRDGDRYVDPSPYLGVLEFRARLIPVDGSRGNAPRPPILTCR